MSVRGEKVCQSLPGEWWLQEAAGALPDSSDQRWKMVALQKGPQAFPLEIALGQSLPKPPGCSWAGWWLFDVQPLGCDEEGRK